MASRTARSPFADRRTVYAVLALLAVAPLVAFALGPLSSESFSLNGPGGPILAFSAGVLSFVSPCVLPIVPIYIAHLSGATVEGGRISTNRRVTFLHAVAFVVGLTAVFMVLGTSVGLLGSYVVRDHQREMEQVAGAVLVALGILLIPSHGRRGPLTAGLTLLGLAAVYFFIADVAGLRGVEGRSPDRAGLLLLGGVLIVAWLRFIGYLPFAFFSRSFQVSVGRNHGVGYSRSALIGGAFALGWTPCIGPILGGILTLAATSSEAWTGTYLLAAYSAGFAVPFLITGLAFSDATKVFKRIQRHSFVIELVSAVVLLGVGLLLWYGRLTGLNSYFGFADFNQGL
jgi:cytochrome c-type biogenesis protein